METMISAAEAKRKFSRLLEGVRLGRSYVVTIQGHPSRESLLVASPDGPTMPQERICLSDCDVKRR